jgi:hypothetical protein
MVGAGIVVGEEECWRLRTEVIISDSNFESMRYQNLKIAIVHIRREPPLRISVNPL